MLQELLLDAVEVLNLLLGRHVLDALEKTLVQDLVVNLRELATSILHLHVVVSSSRVLLSVGALEAKGRLHRVAGTCCTPVSEGVDRVATRVL